MARKICVFTGTRAEYGHLLWLMKEIQSDPGLTLQTLVSGSHLSSIFGETRKQIEADGFSIDEAVDIQLGDDTPVGVARSMALALSGCAQALDRLKPDIIVVLGDRYEALAAAEAALLLRVPIAHIHGGETTEGAIDDAMRHAITKMASLHFAAAEPYRQKIIAMGENPDRVFNFGAPGLDCLMHERLMTRADILEELDLHPGDRFFLATYHPATAGKGLGDGIEALLAAFEAFPNRKIVVTKANADVGGGAVNTRLEAYARERPERMKLFASLGQKRYLSAMAACDVVVGNSSSGLIEAPALGRPTVNIGDRQDGRLRAPSVLDCEEKREAIVTAVTRASTAEFQERAERRESPYGRGDASRRIRQVLAAAATRSVGRAVAAL